MSDCHCEFCIEIPLSRDIAGYKTIRFQVDPTYKDEREIWLVNPQAIIDLPSHKLKFPLPPVETWEEEKREGLRQFLNPKLDMRWEVKHACMPRLSAYRDRCEIMPGFLRRLLGAKPEIRLEELVIFGNGRHRTAFSAYAGAAFIPVQIKAERVDDLRIILGHDNVRPLSNSVSSDQT